MSVLGSNRKWTSGEAVRPYLDLRVGDAVPVEQALQRFGEVVDHHLGRRFDHAAAPRVLRDGTGKGQIRVDQDARSRRPVDVFRFDAEIDVGAGGAAVAGLVALGLGAQFVIVVVDLDVGGGALERQSHRPETQ